MLKPAEIAPGSSIVVESSKVAKHWQEAKLLQPLTADSEWQGERLRMLMQELEVLSEQERRHWLSLAVQDLSERGLLTGAVSRRAALGEIAPGVLGSKAVQIYAEATYGPRWNFRPPSKPDGTD